MQVSHAFSDIILSSSVSNEVISHQPHNSLSSEKKSTSERLPALPLLSKVNDSVGQEAGKSSPLISRLNRDNMGDLRHTALSSHLSSDSANKIGVVHFGIGKLFRGLWAERLHHHMTKTNANDGHILAMDRSDSSSGYQALKEQDGVYTRHIKDSNSEVDLQLITSILDVGALSFEADKHRAIEVMSGVNFKVASLSITPKAYELPEETLRSEIESISKNDVAGLKTPFGLIVQGQQKRFEKGLEPFPVLSLENLANNGHSTRELLLNIAKEVSKDFHTWLEDSLQTPSVMVDRICPKVIGENGADAIRLNTQAGASVLEDVAAVTSELYGLLAIQQSSHPFLQELHDSGAIKMTDQLASIDQMKFALVNGGHVIAGIVNNALDNPADTLHELLERPGIARFMQLAIDEIMAMLPDSQSINKTEYRSEVWQRLTNAALPDKMSRLGSEVTRKIPQYLGPVLQGVFDSGLPSPALLQVLAAAEQSLQRENPGMNATEFLSQCVQTEVHQDRLKTGLALAKNVTAARGIDRVFAEPELIGSSVSDLFKSAGLDYDAFLQNPASVKIESTKPITVLFDNDGTLVDSEFLALEAARHLINDIIDERKAGAPLDKKEFTAEFPGLNFNLILHKLNEVRPNIKLTQADISGYAEREEANCLRILGAQVQPTENTSNVLTMLAANNISSQVVTSATMDRAVVSLDKSGLRNQLNQDIFSAVNTLNPSQPKPSPAIYEHAKIHTAGTHSETQFIAIEDSSSGVKSAVGAGVDVVAYVGGLHHTPEQRYLRGQEFMALGAKAVFDNMALLPLVLKRLGLAQEVRQEQQ